MSMLNTFYKLQYEKKYGKKLAVRKVMSYNKIELLALLLWQGQSKGFICEYFNVEETALDKTLAPLKRRKCGKENMFVDSFYV